MEFRRFEEAFVPAVHYASLKRGWRGGNAAVNIGTVTGNGTANLVVTFNTTDATPAAAGALIQRLAYLNSNTLNPSITQRTVAVSVDDGLSGVDSENVFVNVVDINDEPTLTATGQNPTYTENAAGADLYSAVTASTVESGQTFTSMTLTVTNVTDGADEILFFDGTDVPLVAGNVGPTATNGLTVNVSGAGTTKTVTFSGAALSAAQLQTLVDGLTYRNTSQNPTDANRVVTITQVVDSGSNTSPADNTATVSIVSTVNVDPVNDAAEITGETTGDVTEAGGVNNGTLGDSTDSGDLDFTDVDNSPNDSWQAVVAATASANNDYVTGLYNDVLDRDPDAGGFASWTTQLGSGTPRSSVSRAFLGSEEELRQVVDCFYEEYLDRTPGADEVQGWVDLLEDGAFSPAQVGRFFLASDEYFGLAQGRIPTNTLGQCV